MRPETSDDPQSAGGRWSTAVLLAACGLGLLEALKEVRRHGATSLGVSLATAGWSALAWTVLVGGLALLCGIPTGRRLRRPHPALAVGGVALALQVVRMTEPVQGGAKALALAVAAAAVVVGVVAVGDRWLPRLGRSPGPWLVADAALAACLVLAAGPSATTSPAHAAKPSGRAPSVVVVTIDTLRADRLGAYGYQPARTPHIDAWLEEGVLFEHALSPIPITCPSHVSILTGLDPMEHGITRNDGTPLPRSIPTLADLLAGRGYATAAFVAGYPLKREVCALGDRFGTFHDDFGPRSWVPQLVGRIAPVALLLEAVPALRERAALERRELPAEEVTDRVLAWLEETRERPVFLWIHYYDPHLPYRPPGGSEYAADETDGLWYALPRKERESIARSPARLAHMKALYDEELAYLDTQIGRLREGLASAGLDRDAIWVFTADHGESHGEHDRYFGRGLHAPSLRVPLSLRLPDGAYGGRRVSQPVRLVDVEPTLAAWLGLPEPAGSGRSLLGRVEGERDAPRPAYSLLVGANPDRSYALQDDHYKLIQHSAAWRDHGYRIEPPREELYDVEADPGETRDLGADHPAAAALRPRLSAWRERDPNRDTSHRELAPEVVRRLRSLGYLR